MVTAHRMSLDSRRRRKRETERARDRVWLSLFLAGVSMQTIAHVYGVAPRTVQRVVREGLNRKERTS